MRARVSRLGVAAAALLALGWLSVAATAQAAGHSQVTQIRLPLTGTVGVAADACVAKAETVSFAVEDDVHVLVVKNKHGAFIHVNLDEVLGQDADGNTYVGVGVHKFTGVTIPTDGTLTPALQWEFTLVHNDGCASTPLPVKLTLVFSGGELQASSTAVAGP